MKVKEVIKKMKEYQGKDISKLFSWYLNGGWKISYILELCNNKRVIISCRQGDKTWRLYLKPNEFVKGIDKDILNI
jgi:hypothetical protein